MVADVVSSKFRVFFLSILTLLFVHYKRKTCKYPLIVYGQEFKLKCGGEIYREIDYKHLHYLLCFL